MNHSSLSSLPENLRRLSPAKPVLLGVIARAAKTDLKCTGNATETDHEEFKARVWKYYDGRFYKQDDYKLWRITCRQRYPSTLSLHWAKNSVRILAENALSSHENTATTWGALSVVSGLITSKKGLVSDDDAHILASLCWERLFGNLRPIKGCEAECDLLKLLTMNAVQYAYFERGQYRHVPMTSDQVWEQIRFFSERLRGLDPGWLPPWPVSFNTLRSQRKANSPVAPFKIEELMFRLQAAMFRVRGIVRSCVATMDISDEADSLLEIAAVYALSAWRLARSFRLGEEDWREDYRPKHIHYDLSGVLESETRALQRATQALLDAGEYLLAASYGHLLLRVIRDTPLNKRRLSAVSNDIVFWVRQAGLEVDSRFKKKPSETSENEDVYLIQDRTPTDAKVAPEDVDEEKDENRADTKQLDMYRRRLARDQKTSDCWKLVLKRYGLSAYPLRRLVRDFSAGNSIDIEILKCGYNLCLMYEHIAHAATLLRGFEPTLGQLVDFAHSVKRAQQVMPYGIHMPTHEKWQGLLRDKLACIANLSNTREQDVLTFHEVLLGRSVSISRQASQHGITSLIDKHYGLLNEQLIRDELDRSTVGRFRGPGGVTTANFQRFLTTTSTANALGMPVCISLVSLGNDKWSILATSTNGKWLHDVYSLKLQAEAVETKKHFKSWFLRFRGTVREAIPWGKNFVTLAKIITKICVSLNSEARWILLAIDPSIAALPWQALIQRPTHCGRDIIVSLVPSFSWAALSYHRNSEVKQGVRLVLAQQSELVGDELSGVLSKDELEQIASQMANLLESIKSSKLHRAGISIAIVLGHGTWIDDNADVPAVSVKKKALGWEDWATLWDYRLIIVHSCFGGEVRTKLLGDLGGLPGLALGFSTRLFCAPVAEVPPATSKVLHEYISSNPDDGQAIGSRYLSAISKDPNVAVYNLYGFADERLGMSEASPSDQLRSEA